MYFCIDSHINGIIMKTTKEYISLISSHADELKKVFGIKSLLIFGSVSRNEHTKEAMWMFVWIWNPNPIWLFA